MQPLLKCKRIIKKKDDINLLKGQRKVVRGDGGLTGAIVSFAFF